MSYFEPSPATQTVLDYASAPLIHLIIVPIATLYHTILWVIYGRPFERWTYGHYIRLNRRRVTSGCYAFLRLPRRDIFEARVPPEADKYLGDCQLEQVLVPPLAKGVDESWPEVLSMGQPYVSGTTVPGWWIRSKDADQVDNLSATAAPGERIVYFIVGGGYVGGHPLRIHTPWSIAKITQARVFCINYRKSLSAETAFPASLLDCMAGLQYLQEDRGFEAENKHYSYSFAYACADVVAEQNIMLCGDSAGANASLALAKCLGEMNDLGSDRLGQVGSMCLHSPWVDMTSSFPSLQRNRYTDHLVDMARERIPSHTRHFPSRSNPYFSPALTPEGGFAHLTKPKSKRGNGNGEGNGRGVQVYVSAGTAEAFHDEIVALYRSMKRDGVDALLREIEGATHSDFVWMDRNESTTLGWSWGVVSADFERFWRSAA